MCKLIAGALSLAAMLVTTPVTASPAFIVVAVALATGVGVSASQQPYETWQYTAMIWPQWKSLAMGSRGAWRGVQSLRSMCALSIEFGAFTR